MNYAGVVDEIFSQIKGVRFDIRLWNGETLRYGSGTKRAFTLIFENELAARRLLSQGALGFGESYTDGTLRIEGDIEAYLNLRHQFKKIKPSVRMALATLIATRSIPKDAKDQISYHYDLGNDFFKLFLDRQTMSYSSGLYEKGVKTLEQAQASKLNLVCDWLELPKNAKVLDLGGGWGGFMIQGAKKHGWNITSCSLSKKQLEYCKKLVKTHSLQKKIKLEYRDMLKSLPDGEFDAIVMLESIEHVGKPRLDRFIDSLYKKLKPGGVVYIQTTGRYKPKMPDKWILKYVFPGGYLPAQQELVSGASAAGFELRKFIDDTPSYILTLTEWVKRLESNQSKIESMFGKEFYRLWYLWMHGAKVAFEVRSMGLFRIMLKKPNRL